VVFKPLEVASDALKSCYLDEWPCAYVDITLEAPTIVTTLPYSSATTGKFAEINKNKNKIK